MHASENVVGGQEATQEEEHIHCVCSHRDDSEPILLNNIKGIFEVCNRSMGKVKEGMSEHHMSHRADSHSVEGVSAVTFALSSWLHQLFAVLYHIEVFKTASLLRLRVISLNRFKGCALY